MSQESCVSVLVLDDQTLAVDAVLFDLDGTLVDSVADLYLGVCGMLHDLGLPPIPVEDVRAYVGRGMHNLVKRVLAGSASEGEIILPPNTAYRVLAIDKKTKTIKMEVA